ncbi:VOC family protein [Pararhizobium antarcticum]|uniref:Glyoxalase n=1 Tax=Pararhizobium antarcticum TaxID=1798805 RepID=A0A657LPW2_9HYPH|nr:VOC family protein [Pararhizobium antarcticum]OJF93407.1 glyoxalase [Pararhizobium antarcticum]OJG00489.1 glyoxalase [Rhizobium sp. 58]
MLNRILLYTRDVDVTAAFYERHFGFIRTLDPTDRIGELRHPEGGAILMLHRAGKAQKMGQVLVKLVFGVEDVAGFVARRSADGLVFGTIQDGGGYAYANAKDPDGNSISVSSRAYRG